MIVRRLPSLPTWSSATSEPDTPRRAVERLFDTLSGFTGSPPAGVFPAINVSEDTESVYVRAELPGFQADDFDIVR